MDNRNLRVMRKYIDEFAPRTTRVNVLDVGSYNINGAFRTILPGGWKYVGIDRVNGPNVDVVMKDDYTIPFPSNHFEVVLSGSCFQYVKNPFKLMASISEVMMSGGHVFICVPRYEENGLMGLPASLCHNNDPSFDCWRFLKDGVTALFEESRLVKIVSAYDKRGKCWGIARKP